LVKKLNNFEFDENLCLPRKVRQIWIRDGKKSGSGINKQDPQNWQNERKFFILLFNM
jgi:hypothetical protein